MASLFLLVRKDVPIAFSSFERVGLRGTRHTTHRIDLLSNLYRRIGVHSELATAPPNIIRPSRDI